MTYDLGALFMNALPVALLGGVLGLDMVSFPQIMISRPIVSATVAGAFTGHPAAGLLIGAVLELIALETLPFGASRYPDWGSAGAVGGAIFAAQPMGSLGALPVSVFIALLAAMFSSWSMVIVRKRTGRYALSMRGEIDTGNPKAVGAVQLRGLVLDLLRGIIVTLVSLVVCLPLSQYLVGTWQTDAVYSRAVVTAIAATIAAGAVWNIFHTSARAGWFFLAGLVGGAVVLLQTGL
jgi:mannose/fructose/N-acetylgalactosamine-specific phosphotransferase system component IIC